MHGFQTRFIAAGLGVAFGVAIFGATPCFAQFGGGGTPTGIDAASKRSLRAAQPAPGKGEVAPPVLPGTKAASEAAAPTVLPADLSPTDALFDAINRGDITAARDAVNRGANMDGRNILGLTPVELSVDLGRNDISFMLLSQRGEDATSRRTAQKAADLRGTDLRGGDGPRAVSRSRVAAVSARAPEEPVVATPRLYSGNGGAPIPAAGFLGFDEGRSVR